MTWLHFLARENSDEEEDPRSNNQEPRTKNRAERCNHMCPHVHMCRSPCRSKAVRPPSSLSVPSSLRCQSYIIYYSPCGIDSMAFIFVLRVLRYPHRRFTFCARALIIILSFFVVDLLCYPSVVVVLKRHRPTDGGAAVWHVHS